MPSEWKVKKVGIYILKNTNHNFSSHEVLLMKTYRRPFVRLCLFFCQVFSDEHVTAVGLVKDVELADGAHAKVVGPPVEYSRSHNAVRSPPPLLGQHTVQILSQVLNYSPQKINELKENGHVAWSFVLFHIRS